MKQPAKVNPVLFIAGLISFALGISLICACAFRLSFEGLEVYYGRCPWAFYGPGFGLFVLSKFIFAKISKPGH